MWLAIYFLVRRYVKPTICKTPKISDSFVPKFLAVEPTLSAYFCKQCYGFLGYGLKGNLSIFI